METFSSMVDDLNLLRQRLNRSNKLLEAPKANVISEAAAFSRLEKGLRERDELITQFQVLFEKLQIQQELSTEQERLHRKDIFGASSEQTGNLLDDDVQNPISLSDEENPEPTIDEVTRTEHKRGKKRKGKREEDMSALDQEPLIYEIPEAERICPICGGSATVSFNDYARYEIIRIPEKWVARKIFRQNYGCDNCRKNGRKAPVLHASVPTGLFPRSPSTPEFLAWIIEEKFANGVPLDRIARMLVRDGLHFSTTDFTRWVNKSAILYLEPLVMLMHAELIKEIILHVDESFFQVMNEPGRKASTKSYMWLLQTGKYAIHQIVLLNYFMTRKYANAKELLKGFNGYIICDGYGAYHDLPPEIVPVGCWQHARSKFAAALAVMDVNQRKGSPAEVGLNYINRIFAIEDEFAKSTPHERLRGRIERSKPESDEFFAWAARTAALPKIASSENLLARAVRYAINQRPYMENIYLDGRLEISNNRAERTFAHFAIGRNNWQSANTVDGAQANAIHYSIVLTAMANGLHPRKYVQYLLEKFPTAKSSELPSYLPWSDTLPDYLKLSAGQAKPFYVSLEQV